VCNKSVLCQFTSDWRGWREIGAGKRGLYTVYIYFIVFSLEILNIGIYDKIRIKVTRNEVIGNDARQLEEVSGTMTFVNQRK